MGFGAIPVTPNNTLYAPGHLTQVLYMLPQAVVKQRVLDFRLVPGQELVFQFVAGQRQDLEFLDIKVRLETANGDLVCPELAITASNMSRGTFQEFEIGCTVPSNMTLFDNAELNLCFLAGRDGGEALVDHLRLQTDRFVFAVTTAGPAFTTTALETTTAPDEAALPLVINGAFEIPDLRLTNVSATRTVVNWTTDGHVVIADDRASLILPEIDEELLNGPQVLVLSGNASACHRVAVDANPPAFLELSLTLGWPQGYHLPGSFAIDFSDCSSGNAVASSGVRLTQSQLTMLPGLTEGSGVSLRTQLPVTASGLCFCLRAQVDASPLACAVAIDDVRAEVTNSSDGAMFDLNGILAGSDAEALFRLKGQPILLSPAAVVAGYGLVTGMNVTLRAKPEGIAFSPFFEVLSAVGQQGITVSYVQRDGRLELRGLGNSSVYQRVLRTLSYFNSAPTSKPLPSRLGGRLLAVTASTASGLLQRWIDVDFIAACLDTEFDNGTACRLASVCSPFDYQALPLTEISNRKCVECGLGPCVNGTYETKACSVSSDRVCSPLPTVGPRIDCQLSSWSPWSGCGGSCATSFVRSRQRAQAVPAEFGGANCTGLLQEDEPCVPTFTSCPGVCESTVLTGLDCDVAFNGCAAAGCSATGTLECSNVATCTCPPQFTGLMCMQDVNECALRLDTCVNSTCNNTYGSFECVCPAEHSGAGTLASPCTPVDECETHTCFNGGTCLDTLGAAPQCQCPVGYTGSQCELFRDVDCDSSPCSNGGTCINQPGPSNYTCSCPLGYLGDRCQQQINECEGSPCANGGTCVDGPGSFFCLCPLGFDGPTCRDLECSAHRCDANTSLVCVPVSRVIRTAPDGTISINPNAGSSPCGPLRTCTEVDGELQCCFATAVCAVPAETISYSTAALLSNPVVQPADLRKGVLELSNRSCTTAVGPSSADGQVAGDRASLSLLFKLDSSMVVGQSLGKAFS